MNKITAYAVKNLCYQAQTPMKPVGILVHSTGANNPNLKRYVDAPDEVGVNPYNNHWNNPLAEGQKMCVHAFVGKDKNGAVRWADILPYNIASWGCGGSFNYNPVGHIQFEICEDNLLDAAYFNEAYRVAVEGCALICKEYGFDPLGKNVIVSHREAAALGCASNHGDPDYWFKNHGKTMASFRNDVKSALDKMNAPEPVQEEKPAEKVLYRVQVGAYSVRANAEKQLEKVKAAGFADAFITKGV